MYINDDTRALLTIMRFRAVGLWLGEISRSPSTAESYSALLHQDCDDDEFMVRAGELLASTLRDGINLGASLAPRLCPEFAAIFWTQLTDRLIEQQECDYKNFAAFRSSRATGVLRVTFEPSDLLLNRNLPEPMRSVVPAEQNIDDFCRSVMDTQRRSILEWPDFGPFREWRLPLAATALLTASLDQLLRGLATDEQVMKSVQGLAGATEHGRDWLTVFSTATSYSTYYAWSNAFAAVLESGSVVEVDGVGAFRKAQLKIEFEAHVKFQNLLDVNTISAQRFAA